MKTKLIVTLIISFVTFQIFCLILIQPYTIYAQSRFCEYISPIGVKRFTRQEQRRHGFNSSQNLLCYAKVRNCQSIPPDSDFIPQTESTVMCDVGPCTRHGECMCPRNPMECFRDPIDGRSRYRNGQRMIKVDDDVSGCQNRGPIRAKIFTREEQRRHGFNSGNRYLCYSNAQNCRVNGMPVNTNIVICDTAYSPCSIGFVSGILCSCPTNLNECFRDTIDGTNIYLWDTEMIQADEQSYNPGHERRPRRGGRGLRR